MRNLFITCTCGQQMQVPRSAIGKMGQCPSCGEKIPITRETTSRTRRAAVAKGSPNQRRWDGGVGPSLDAKQRFGRAVDLYCSGKYGEALVVFDTLMQEFPESMEIEKARQQCIEARNRDPLHLPDPGSGQVMGDVLDEDILRSMRRIVVEKMLRGATDSVQLQAAELVARMGGILNGPKPGDTEEPPEKEDSDTEDIQANSGGNGHTVESDDAPLDVDADVEMESP